VRLARLLADPWTVGAGTFIGALAVAGLGLPVAVGAAAAVGGYAVGTAVKALTSRDRDPGPQPAPDLVLPPHGTEARALYERARAAVGDLGEIAESQQPGPLREQAGSVHGQAREALDGIGRIAAQTVVLRSALTRVDVAQAQRDALRLEQARAQDGGAHEESLAAVRSQLEVAARLEKAARAAENRLLSSALGLEALVASLAEVVAMASSTGDGDAGPRIRSLTEDLTGLRQGLAEAEETSRRALSA
jgi:hypothetical protein